MRFACRLASWRRRARARTSAGDDARSRRVNSARRCKLQKQVFTAPSGDPRRKIRPEQWGADPKRRIRKGGSENGDSRNPGAVFAPHARSVAARRGRTKQARRNRRHPPSRPEVHAVRLCVLDHAQQDCRLAETHVPRQLSGRNARSDEFTNTAQARASGATPSTGRSAFTMRSNRTTPFQVQ